GVEGGGKKQHRSHHGGGNGGLPDSAQDPARGVSDRRRAAWQRLLLERGTNTLENVGAGADMRFLTQRGADEMPALPGLQDILVQRALLEYAAKFDRVGLVIHQG